MSTPIRAPLHGRFTSLARSDLPSRAPRRLRRLTAHFGVSVGSREPVVDGGSLRSPTDGRERFDLVVGADGLHSHVRALAFGPEAQFETPLGCYVAAFRFPGYPRRDELTYVMHTVPDARSRASAAQQRTLILLICRTERVDGDPPPGAEKDALRRHSATWAGKSRKSLTPWTTPRGLFRPRQPDPPPALVLQAESPSSATRRPAVVARWRRERAGNDRSVRPSRASYIARTVITRVPSRRTRLGCARS